jgi:putative photosynthetic complex assembly protein
MAHTHDTMIIPKPALIGAGVLIATALAITAAGSAGLYKTPKAAFAEHRASVPITKSRQLTLRARDDGAILVTDLATGQAVRTIASNEGGFIHYTLTGLRYARQSHGLGQSVNITILQYDDGRLMVKDDATGVLVDVVGYGPTNVASYNALLNDQPLPQIPGRR